MTETLPFQHGMKLGRTYDLRRHAIGPDIFPMDYTANQETTPCPSTRIKYQVIKNSSDVNNVLDVSGDISLKAKAGILNVQGMGSYLKDSRSEENALEIMAVAHVETVCTTLINPKSPDNWNKNTLGSHYIRSVIYGGDLIIKISYIATDSKQKEEIKAKVKAGFQIQGIVDVEGRANLRTMLQDIKDKSEIKFSYYSTVPCTELPRDVDGMLKALDDFPNQLAKIDEGKGAPLRCELVPLTYLDPDFPAVLRKTGLETQMRELENKYDDIRQSKAMLETFLEDTAEYMTTEQGDKGNEIDNMIQNVMSRFNTVISTLDVTTEGDSLNQIEDAVNFYRTNKRFVNFRTEVKMFIKEVQPHITTTACEKGFSSRSNIHIQQQGMSEIVPYQSSMVLGRTYDLKNNRPGRDIFPEMYITNPKTIECSSVTIKYQVIKSCSDVKNLLEVSGDISLRVKAGILNVKGFGSYLSENRSEENMLEILGVAHVETLCTTLMNPQPYDNWKKNPQGTHYINSIIYGGDLVISIRIVASNSKHLEEIKAKVDSKLKVKSIVDAEARANFTKMEQDLKESSEINFSYYCTAPYTEIPKDVASMLKALDDFQTQLKTVNDGKGSPLRCELVSLSHLDPDFPAVLRQTGLEIQLGEFEEIYDEIRQAKCMLQKKLATVKCMTQKEREIGDELEKRIDDVKSCFNKVISSLNVTTTWDDIQQAVDYYRKNKKFGGFRIEVKMLFKDDQPHISTGASGTPVKDLPPGQQVLSL